MRKIGSAVCFGLLGVLLVACNGSTNADESGKTSVVASFYPLAEAAQGRWGSRLGREPDAAGGGAARPGARPRRHRGDRHRRRDRLPRRRVPARGRGRDLRGRARRDRGRPEGGRHERGAGERGGGGSDGGPTRLAGPGRYEEVVRTVADALSEADPTNESSYAANADAYVAKIAALDEEFRAGLADCERTTIVTSHEAFGYLAEAYGLTRWGSSACRPRRSPRPGGSPSSGTWSSARASRRSSRRSSCRPRSPRRSRARPASRSSVLDPIESLTDEQVEAGEDYLSVMRENLDILRKALGCS